MFNLLPQKLFFSFSPTKVCFEMLKVFLYYNNNSARGTALVPDATDGTLGWTSSIGWHQHTSA
jgi:hypothetical protein